MAEEHDHEHDGRRDQGAAAQVPVQQRAHGEGPGRQRQREQQRPHELVEEHLADVGGVHEEHGIGAEQEGIAAANATGSPRPGNVARVARDVPILAPMERSIGCPARTARPASRPATRSGHERPSCAPS